MRSKDLIIEDMKRKLADFHQQQQKSGNKSAAAASPDSANSGGSGQSDLGMDQIIHMLSSIFFMKFNIFQF